jgi:hypothetical protein
MSCCAGLVDVRTGCRDRDRVRDGGPENRLGCVSVEGGYKPSRSDAIVDLPEPEEPAMAVHRPLGMVKLRFDKAGASGPDG